MYTYTSVNIAHAYVHTKTLTHTGAQPPTRAFGRRTLDKRAWNRIDTDQKLAQREGEVPARCLDCCVQRGRLSSVKQQHPNLCVTPWLGNLAKGCMLRTHKYSISTPPWLPHSFYACVYACVAACMCVRAHARTHACDKTYI